MLDGLISASCRMESFLAFKLFMLNVVGNLHEIFTL